MKTTGYRTRKVKDALLECPSLIPILLRDKTFDPKITKGILYNLIPRRTSIEIESFGNLTHLSDDFNVNSTISGEYTKLAKKLKVMNIYRDGTLSGDSYDEHSISIMNYSQALGLYKFLELMKANCEVNLNSGCHIHVDIRDILLRVYNKFHSEKADEYHWNRVGNYFDKWISKELRNSKIEIFFNNFIENGTLERIFGPYDSGYNPKYFTFDKRGVISLRPNLGSIEFRWAPQTFEYTTIIKWYIECNKIINQFSKLIDELLAKDKTSIIPSNKNIPLDERLKYHLREHANCDEEDTIKYSTSHRISGLDHFYGCRECNPV